MVKNRVNEILRQSISDILKHRGFQKQGMLYVRRLGDVLHMIEVQRSRWNDTTRQSFTLNCGVYVPGVTSAFRNTTDAERPKLTDCCISVRVGMLRTPWHDIWWEISNNDGADKDAEIRGEIASIVTESALPFVERFPSEKEIIHFLTTEHIGSDKLVEPCAEGFQFSYAALLWRRLGEIHKCSMCLEEAKQRSKKTPLETVVAAFADRCRC